MIPADDDDVAACKRSAAAADLKEARKLVLSQPAPAFDEIVSQRSSTSTSATKPKEDVADEADEADAVPCKPPPAFVSRRMPTNISLIPQHSRVDAEMLMAAMRLTDARPFSPDIKE